MERLGQLDWVERQMELAQGFLTGNIFDWGASEAVRFFTQSRDSVEGMASFEQALAKLQVRSIISDWQDNCILLSFCLLVGRF